MKEVIIKGACIYTFTDTGFEFTVKPFTLAYRLFTIFIILLGLSLMIFFLALAIIDGSIGHIIIFSLVFIVAVPVSVYYVYEPMFRHKRFRFTVDEKGITYTEIIDNTYFIKWDDLICFGFINGCLMETRYVYPRMHIYFSTLPYNQHKFRRTLDIRQGSMVHTHNNEIISYAFLKNQMDEEFMEKIRERICLYTDKEKEINDIRPDCEFMDPW